MAIGRRRWINSLGWFYSLSQRPLRRQCIDQEILDPHEILAHIRWLAGQIGPRPAGSAMAHSASAYVSDCLQQMGYAVHRQEYFLPDRSVAENVWAEKGGTLKSHLIIAAHTDTVKGCPGANDDASGVAAALAIARKVAGSRLRTGVRFLAIGAEEALLDGFVKPGFGALQYVQRLSPEERAKISGVVWLDKIGAGPSLQIRHVRGTDPKTAELLSLGAKHLGLQIDPRPARRWEPLMPFEDSGFSTARLEWWRDPYLHEPQDTPQRISLRKVMTAGAVVYSALLDVNGLVSMPVQEWLGHPDLVPTVVGSMRISARSRLARTGSE